MTNYLGSIFRCLLWFYRAPRIWLSVCSESLVSLLESGWLINKHVNSDNVRIQWHAGKCLTAGSWGEKEAWFIAFAHFCDVNTPTMVCFKLQHDVICLAKFLKLTVSSQSLLSWSKPVVAHQRVMIYSVFCSDQSAWRSVGLWSPSIFQYHCYSITKSCPTLCDPVDCSMPSFPVLRHFQN